MSALGNTKLRLERLADERTRVEEKVEDILEAAEEEKRDLGDFENEQLAKHRTRVQELEDEINLLASDLERAKSSKDISALLRDEPIAETSEGGPVVYRTFAAYARDQLIVQFPKIAEYAGGGQREAALDRVQRTIQNTTTTSIAGLLPPAHMAQIMDLINGSRPVVASAKQVNLDRGSLTYPKIAQRPSVIKQTAEKTEAGTANMQITLETLTAETYLGGGDLSWQAINWSTPDALQLWFELAAEAYARQTETAACTELSSAASGTVSPVLGTVGTEDFGAWRSAVIDAIGTIYTAQGGRAKTDTLYVSAVRFFQLAALGSGNVVQLSPVGNLDVGALTGTFSGLRVVGSYGFTGNTTIVGDSSAFLVGETPGTPVEMRAVEPAIGGMEVGVIGAFKAKVFDTNRFLKLNA
jgi:HK97 family phage major capsid protein